MNARLGGGSGGVWRICRYARKAAIVGYFCISGSVSRSQSLIFEGDGTLVGEVPDRINKEVRGTVVVIGGLLSFSSSFIHSSYTDINPYINF